MTPEEKGLLIEELCTRLPYGVVVHFEGWNPEKLTQIDLRELVFNDMGGIPKPYLRPWLSMTEKEIKEIQTILGGVIVDTETNTISVLETQAVFKYLNKKMIDYRGLIEKGLALEAPEGMYNN